MTRRIPRNYEEARHLADLARARAYARIDRLTRVEEAHQAHIESLPRRARPDVSIPLDVAVDRRVADDSRYKVAVSDNRWYIDYAVMYAQGEQLELLRELNTNVARLLERIKTNDAHPYAKPHPRITREERG